MVGRVSGYGRSGWSKWVGRPKHRECSNSRLSCSTTMYTRIEGGSRALAHSSRGARETRRGSWTPFSSSPSSVGTMTIALVLRMRGTSSESSKTKLETSSVRKACSS